MIAGDIEDLGALPRPAEQFLDHVVVGLGPIPVPVQPPAIDDVAHQIKIFGLMAA
jgi:hypothetical protein